MVSFGLAWVLTYVETLKETANWADRIDAEGRFGEIEQLQTRMNGPPDRRARPPLLQPWSPAARP